MRDTAVPATLAALLRDYEARINRLEINAASTNRWGQPWGLVYRVRRDVASGWLTCTANTETDIATPGYVQFIGHRRYLLVGTMSQYSPAGATNCTFRLWANGSPLQSGEVAPNTTMGRAFTITDIYEPSYDTYGLVKFTANFTGAVGYVLCDSAGPRVATYSIIDIGPNGTP